MGSICSSETSPSKYCSVCNCKETREAYFINNKCRRCVLVQQSMPSTDRTSAPNLNRNNVRVGSARPRPKTASNKSQFGEYYCKSCGRAWKSIRSWSNKYQMCKRCKIPVYPHKLRELLSSDYKTANEDSKEHERELCEMCRQLGYACKSYSESI